MNVEDKYLQRSLLKSGFNCKNCDIVYWIQSNRKVGVKLSLALLILKVKEILIKYNLIKVTIILTVKNTLLLQNETYLIIEELQVYFLFTHFLPFKKMEVKLVYGEVLVSGVLSKACLIFDSSTVENVCIYTPCTKWLLVEPIQMHLILMRCQLMSTTEMELNGCVIQW